MVVFLTELSNFTYEHRIIQEAKFIADSLKDDGTIFDNKISAKTANILQIFSKIDNIVLIKSTEINGVSTLLVNFTKLIKDYCNSNLSMESIHKFSQNLMDTLIEIQFETVDIRNFSEVFLESLLLQEVLESSDKSEYLIVNNSVIDQFLNKLNSQGNETEILKFVRFLKEICDNKLINDINSENFNDIILEGVTQLLFEKILSKKIEQNTVSKIKLRRLAYIKNLIDKLSIFHNIENSVIKPSENLIYGILFSACILEILSYKRSISLNYLEALNYIDNEAKSNLVEKTIKEERRKTLEESLMFSVSFSLGKFGINWHGRLPLHQALVLYTLNWIIATSITTIYVLIEPYRTISFYLILISYTSLIYFTVSIIYQARKKWLKNQ